MINQRFLLLCFVVIVKATFYQPLTVAPQTISGFGSGVPAISKSTWIPANGTILCYDPTINSTWMFLSDETLLLVSSTAQTILQLNATLSGMYPMAICDISSHTILYYDKTDGGNLVSFNYLNTTTSYQIYVNYKVPMNPMAGQWTGNSSNFTKLFAVSNSLNIQSYNVSTGELLETSSATISSYEILYVEDGIAALVNDTATIFDEETLTMRCTISQENIFQLNTNGNYLYSITNSKEISSYDSNCTFRWRTPMTSYVYNIYNARVLFSFDFSGNVFLQATPEYLGQPILQINDKGQVSPIEVQEFTYLYGIDEQGYFYFYCWNCPPSYQNTITFYKYSTTKREIKTISHTTPGPAYNGSPSDIVVTVGLTSQGTIYQFQDYEICVFTTPTETKYPFVMLSNLLLVGFSFIIVIALSIKHCLCGADPKGWNKWKIPEVASCIILTIIIIIVGMITIYTQFQLVKEVQENTENFSISPQDFYNSFLEPCGNGTGVATPLDLCTCAGNTNQNLCAPGACENGTTLTCGELYKETCDCANSFYAYDCHCTYLEGDACSIHVTNTSTPNSSVEKSWESCQREYYYPTLVLWITFALSILSSVVIVLLNILQCYLKFDSGKMEVLISVVSVGISLIIFTVALLGSNLLQVGNSCLTSVMNEIPGCALNSAGSELSSQETSAQISLVAAYQNLLASPFVFILCAIPDIISMFSCVIPKRRREVELLLLNETEEDQPTSQDESENNMKDDKCIEFMIYFRQSCGAKVFLWIMKISCCCFCFSSIITLLFLLYFGVI